ncbi:hypothetical protein Q31b_52840 [Novipirellula aureliae]|uniref:Uncharacterized protein n=1 Tax=Novipirellula aureliae TaxID=2527966 RepID=A0A5C6DES6_9BACT|nr:hypothetical protein Q31b_52840 [Novipirellula aureliae]
MAVRTDSYIAERYGSAGPRERLTASKTLIRGLMVTRIHSNGLTTPEPVAQLKAMGKPSKTDADAKFFALINLKPLVNVNDE